MSYDLISSANNPLIRQINGLQKKRERDKIGLFVVEGLREIELAAGSGVVIKHLMVNQKWAKKELDSFIHKCGVKGAVVVENEIFNRVSYRGRVTNALALCQIKKRALSDLKLPSRPLILVLESLEKPGNIGAIFRTADAAGVNAILLADPDTDIFNPNIIRSSLGSLFTVPYVCGTNEIILDWLIENKIRIVATWMQAASSHFDADYSSATAIVLGSEAKGISPFWQTHANSTIKIPMRGVVDSMNVSTACAVVVYEAVRQRS